MKERDIYVCDKCGKKFEELPIKHGIVSIWFGAGEAPHARDCDGEVVKIDKDEKYNVKISGDSPLE